MFAEKLDFLMNIVGISGGELAHATSLDPSYISRLRHGKRELPKGQHFIDPIAHYFAQHIKSEYQKKLLCDAMEYTCRWPENQEMAANYILKWLLTENAVQLEIIQNVLQQAAISLPLDMAITPDENVDLTDCRGDDREIYYGAEGKRLAFLRFLSLAVAADTPLEMFMYSDEDLTWLSEDTDFSSKTLSLLTKCAKDGKKIKIVHPLRRDADAMLYTVRRWFPIYLAGYVEPYYYPIVRDELYYRTSFVISGVGAMVSSSIGGNTSEGMTFFLTESRAVAVVEEELNHLISISKPLAKVYSARNSEGFWTMLTAFACAEAETIMLHDNLCTFGMFRNVRNISDRVENFSFQLHEFESLLRRHKFTEVVVAPDLKNICDGKIPLQFSELTGNGQQFLTKQQYAENLNYILQMLHKKENYNLMIRHHAPSNMFLCIKEGVGILLAKVDETARIFYITQPNIVQAAWGYLAMLKVDATIENKENVITELKAMVQSLE